MNFKKWSMISILIALLKWEYDTSPSLAAILFLHHWLPYCFYIIGCVWNGCFTSRVLYRFNQQIIPSGSQDIIFESRVPKAMKTPCNREVCPSVIILIIRIIRSGPTHANAGVIYLGKWWEENFRVVFMTQNSLLASIIQSLLFLLLLTIWLAC